MKQNRPKKKSLMIRLGIFACAAYVVVSLVSLQMDITSSRNVLDTLNQQVEAQRIANKEIERQLSLGDDESYLARIARDKLDMGFPDEHVYRDASGS